MTVVEAPDRLGDALIRLAARFDPTPALLRDPLGVVRRYPAAEREVVAHIAAPLAYGAVGLLVPAIQRVLAALGDSPTHALGSWAPGRFVELDPDFVYRMTRAVDVDGYLTGLSRVLGERGSLKLGFARHDDGGDDLRGALSGYVGELRFASALRTRGLDYLTPDPAKGSATKRWHLMLRWLVRPDDGADLGLWTELGPARLTLPLDTHTARLARYLGLTNRRAVDAIAAREATDSLRHIDATDPVRFDMPLCHLGISGACQHRFIATVCGVCDLCGVCRWTHGR